MKRRLVESVKRWKGGRLSIALYKPRWYFSWKNVSSFKFKFRLLWQSVIVCFQVENIQIEIRLTRCLLNPDDRYIKQKIFVCLFLRCFECWAPVWEIVYICWKFTKKKVEEEEKILSLRNVEQCIFLHRTFVSRKLSTPFISTWIKINSWDDSRCLAFVPMTWEVAYKDQFRILSKWMFHRQA